MTSWLMALQGHLPSLKGPGKVIAIGDDPKDRKKASVTPVFKEEDLGELQAYQHHLDLWEG